LRRVYAETNRDFEQSRARVRKCI